MAEANWSDAGMLRLIELWVVPPTALLLKLALILPFSVNYGALTRTAFSLLTASDGIVRDGIVRDTITDESTQHTRKFVSRAIDARAHAHTCRYYRILPTSGRALNRSMNEVVQCKQGQNCSTVRFQQVIQNRFMQV